MLHVDIAAPAGARRQMTFDGNEVVVGRDPACDLVLDDDGVSGEHLRVVARDGRVMLMDLQSSGGTFVGGHRVQRPIRVAAGDEVRVGGHRLRFWVEGRLGSTLVDVVDDEITDRASSPPNPRPAAATPVVVRPGSSAMWVSRDQLKKQGDD